MAENKGRNNAQSLFGMHQIPSDNHIRDLLDEVEPTQVFSGFGKFSEYWRKGNTYQGFAALRTIR